MDPITFIDVRDLKEACKLLDKHSGEAYLLAGGTDLLVNLRNGKLNPLYIINLNTIHELKSITQLPDGRMRIGALATLSSISAHPIIQSKYQAVTEACRMVGSRQIQNIGTMVGNICNASPAADTVPALLLFEAQVNIIGSDNKRSIALEKFFKGPGLTILEHGEIVESVDLQAPDGLSESCYLKLGRTKGVDLSIVGAGVYVGKNNDTRVSFASVAPAPTRMYEIEDILSDGPFDKNNVEKADRVLKTAVQPISDIRASKEYRREMAAVLMNRALGIVEDRTRSRSNTGNDK